MCEFVPDPPLVQRGRDARLDAFEGSQAISSDAYFGNGAGGSDSRQSRPTEYEDSMGDLVDTGKKLANMASSFFSDMAEKYSS